MSILIFFQTLDNAVNIEAGKNLILKQVWFYSFSRM